MGEDANTKSRPTLGKGLSRADSFKHEFENIMVHLKEQKQKEAHRKKVEEKHRAHSTMRLLDVRMRERERALQTLAGVPDIPAKWRAP